METLTSDELLAVLKAAKEKSVRDWLIYLIQFSHALRISEVLDLRTDNVKDGIIVVQRKKGSRKTVHPIRSHRGQPLLNEARGLSEWMKIRPKDYGDYLFALTPRQANRLFHKYCSEAGIAPYKSHTHCLKHASLTILARAGMDSFSLQQFAGHASPTSTRVYVTLNDSEVSEKANNALLTVF